MKKKAGIWIDTKNAVIVFLEENNHTVKTIQSDIETRERVPGEKKWFTRFGNQFFDFKKKKDNRRANEIRNYLKKVCDVIQPAGEIVLFGPAAMKKELEKSIRNDPAITTEIKAVETAGSMTENQIAAWVKQFFMNKN